MKKEQFEKFDKEYVYCECCNEMVSIKNISYSHLRKNGTVTRCHYCDWIKRHQGECYVPGISEEKVMKCLKLVINNEFDCLNNLASELQLSLEDTIKIIKTTVCIFNKSKQFLFKEMLLGIQKIYYRRKQSFF